MKKTIRKIDTVAIRNRFAETGKEVCVKTVTLSNFEKVAELMRNSNVLLGSSPYKDWYKCRSTTVVCFNVSASMYSIWDAEDCTEDEVLSYTEFLREYTYEPERDEMAKPVVLEEDENMFLPKPKEGSQPFLEVQEITTNGVSVTVSIDYKLKTVSLVEYVNSKDIRGKEWKFVGRGTSYQKGWKDILKAMETAMDYGFNKLKGAE